MPFFPRPNDVLVIADAAYRVTEHPGAPMMAHSLAGRAGHVYRLEMESGEEVALKVFDPHSRDPAHVVLATRLSSLANVPGLAACRQRVLSPRRHRELLHREPDLLYAVIMPWIKGPTWAEIVIDQRRLAPETSLEVARALTDVLQGLEERGLAHCDISGSNVLLPGLETGDESSFVELVDVDQFYGRILDPPASPPAGSPGYAHKTADEGHWGPRADRFAGAVMIAEILGWSDPKIAASVTDESFFTTSDLQDVQCDTYKRLLVSLRTQWGDRVANLFQKAWLSETLDDCPSFGEWLLALPSDTRAPVAVGEQLLDPETIDWQADEMYRRAVEARRNHDWEESLRYLQAVRSLRPEYALSETDHALLDEYESTAPTPDARPPENRPTVPLPRPPRPAPPQPPPAAQPVWEPVLEWFDHIALPRREVVAASVVAVFVVAVALFVGLNLIRPRAPTPPVVTPAAVATPANSGTPTTLFIPTAGPAAP